MSGDFTGSCVQVHRLCPEDEHVYAYCHDAALYKYSFLVRLHFTPMCPALHVEEVYRDYSISYDRAQYLARMHMVSTICLWPTVHVYNNQHVHNCSVRPCMYHSTCTGRHACIHVTYHNSDKARCHRACTLLRKLLPQRTLCGQLGVISLAQKPS